MPNKQNTQEAAATARILKNIVMTDEDMREVLISEAKLLTPDATSDLLLLILDEIEKNNTENDRIDKILLSVRGGYLHGFINAMKAYNDCIKEVLEAL